MRRGSDWSGRKKETDFSYSFHDSAKGKHFSSLMKNRNFSWSVIAKLSSRRRYRSSAVCSGSLPFSFTRFTLNIVKRAAEWYFRIKSHYKYSYGSRRQNEANYSNSIKIGLTRLNQRCVSLHPANMYKKGCIFCSLNTKCVNKSIGRHSFCS